MPTTKPRVSAVVDEDTLNKLTTMAQAERRSLSNYVSSVLQDHVNGASRATPQQPALKDPK